MTCAFQKDMLTAYYDGELDAGEKAEVERHISACSECLRELGEIKSASVLIKTLPRPRAPQGLAAGVAREIAASGRRTRFEAARKAALWVTAAAAGLFVVANVLWFSAPERSPAAAEAPAPAGRREQLAKAPASEPAASRRTEQRSAPPPPAPEAAPEKKQADEGLAVLEQERRMLREAKDKAAEADAAPLAKADAPPAEKAVKPAAPPVPPPPAAASPAPAQAPAEGAAKLRQDAPPTAYVCESVGKPPAAARAAVEAFARRGAPRRKGVAGAGPDSPPPPLTMDLTDEELAALSKELQKQGLRLVPASPEQEQQLKEAQGAKTRQATSGDTRKKALASTPEAGRAAPGADALPPRPNTRRIIIYFTQK